MDTDSTALLYAKVVTKKLKLKNSPLDGTDVDHVAVDFGTDKFFPVVSFINRLERMFECVDLGNGETLTDYARLKYLANDKKST